MQRLEVLNNDSVICCTFVFNVIFKCDWLDFFLFEAILRYNSKFTSKNKFGLILVAVKHLMNSYVRKDEVNKSIFDRTPQLKTLQNPAKSSIKT